LPAQLTPGGLHAARVPSPPALAGVDNLPEGRAPVGIEMHDEAIALLTELKLISRLGLGNGGALLTATRNTARSAYASDSLGTLEPGKLADVIVLNGRSEACSQGAAAGRSRSSCRRRPGSLRG
jgi:hypothetical protein